MGEGQEGRETETESRRREGSQEMNTVLLGEECGMDDVPWRLDAVKESLMTGNKPLKTTQWHHESSVKLGMTDTWAPRY